MHTHRVKSCVPHPSAAANRELCFGNLKTSPWMYFHPVSSWSSAVSSSWAYLLAEKSKNKYKFKALAIFLKVQTHCRKFSHHARPREGKCSYNLQGLKNHLTSVFKEVISISHDLKFYQLSKYNHRENSYKGNTLTWQSHFWGLAWELLQENQLRAELWRMNL